MFIALRVIVSFTLIAIVRIRPPGSAATSLSFVLIAVGLVYFGLSTGTVVVLTTLHSSTSPFHLVVQTHYAETASWTRGVARVREDTYSGLALLGTRQERRGGQSLVLKNMFSRTLRGGAAQGTSAAGLPPALTRVIPSLVVWTGDVSFSVRALFLSTVAHG